jgi:prolipoprotein diacylglyceryl transferase
MQNILLYITWNPSLEAFHIGPVAFRWYSMCWLVGLLLAYLVVKRLYKEQKIGEEKFEPLFIYCFLGILIGARLGHCLFYQPDYFLTSGKGLVEMLLPIHIDAQGAWHMTGYQGLASHGGTLGLIIALLLYVRRIKVPLWQVLDNIAIATGTTACFIRLGNLMNSEIIGKVITTAADEAPWYSFWFTRVDATPAFRHPGQLYEAIAYALLFVLMWVIYRRSATPSQTNGQTTKRPVPPVGTGFYFGLCLTYIFTFRFFIEYTKEVQETFEEGMLFDMGQLLSIPFVILGLWSMKRSYK